MALLSRVSRLLRADLHAVLDHLEEPDVLLRQAVREMEEALAADAERLKRQRHEHGQVVRREQELRQALATLDGELDVCFDAGEHDLARSLCRRKVDAEKLLEAIARRRETQAQELNALTERCQEQRLRFESMRQKAELFAAESADAGDDPLPTSHGAPPTGADEVEVAFLREQRKRRAS